MYKQGKFINLDNYEILKDEINNFDLIMFRGDDIISDKIVELQNNDIFTHAGLIIKSDILPQYSLDPHNIYILESTFSHEIIGIDNGPSDIITNNKFFGVQLREFKHVCRSYLKNDKTKIKWFPLKSCPNVSDFNIIFSKYHMKPFLNEKMLPIDIFGKINQYTMEIAKILITKKLLLTILQSSFSCVNLVTSIYLDLGIISDNKNISLPIDLLNLTL